MLAVNATVMSQAPQSVGSPTQRFGEDSSGNPPGAPATDPSEGDPAVGEILSLLGDEYVCDLLRALDEGPKPARQLAGECNMSRATAYRRLEELTDSGLVAATLRVEADGHHRKEFRLVFEGLEVQLGSDGLDGAVHLAPT